MKFTFQKFAFIFFATILAFSLTSCEPEDPDAGEETITTVRLNFDNGVNAVTWMEGQSAPDITLAENTTYKVTVEFLDESDPNDVEDITEEIEEEDDEHLVCYEVTSADLSIQRTDSDGQFEIGLASEWTTGSASTGVLVLELRHQPGVKDGSCDPGDSDVEVDFNVIIQ